MVMGRRWRWTILLLWCFSTPDIDRVHAQLPSTEGFISIDCGIPAGHDYTDSITNIPYTSDAGFIDSGDNYNVTSLTPQESTLRSFANGPQRNCYTIKPVQNDLKYLVRATFMYGNYDGNYTTSANNIVFNLHIGVNFWTTINIVNASVVYSVEALVAPTRVFIWVCLVNIGSGTPFISSLEVRPLEKTIYNAVKATKPLGLLARVDMGSSGKAVRYPDDLYDRIWAPDSDSIMYPNIPDEWQAISTNSTIRYLDSDFFRVPSRVMQTAVIRQVKNDDWLNFSWDGGRDWDGADYKYYMNIHFTDIDESALKLLRKLNVYVNDDLWLHNYQPPIMVPGYQYSTRPFDQTDEHTDEYTVSIRGSNDQDSGLPPIMSAPEVYYVINLPELATDDNDVDALMSVKNQYQVKKNWMGDPCAPQNYTWDGVNCMIIYGNSGTPRVISLNLCSSGLTGEIPSSLEKLTAITGLDLSDNNLTGTIPGFLADLPFLNFLNLSGNQLTGFVPDALTSKSNNGSLLLSVDGNPNLCTYRLLCELKEEEEEEKKKKKKKKQIILICSLTLVPVPVLVAVLLSVWVTRRRKLQEGSTLCTSLAFSEDSLPVAPMAVIQAKEDGSKQLINSQDRRPSFKMERFQYTEIQKMTYNLKQRLGSGGFGSVFYGRFNGRDVAVKMMYASKGNAIKVFRREAKVMFRTDHENVVKLIGYCKESDHLALVSECMAGGDLKNKLRDGALGNGLLSWEQRLRIASGTAKGLKYLHDTCDIIHRDVKSNNILLDEHLEAKVADFGLSKFCNSDTLTTSVEGFTLGYIAPEITGPKCQTKKTDVFSFGVVLLELITGKPAVIGELHISDWVKGKALNAIVDSSLNGVYDVESVEKVKNLAEMCMEHDPNKRPDMSTVVMQLMPYARYGTPSTSRSGSFAFGIIDNASSSTGP